MKTQNLGQMTAQLVKIVNAQGYYGYRKARLVAESYGFRTLAQAINVIADRSSEKVVRELGLNELIIH